MRTKLSVQSKGVLIVFSYLTQIRKKMCRIHSKWRRQQRDHVAGAKRTDADGRSQEIQEILGSKQLQRILSVPNPLKTFLSQHIAAILACWPFLLHQHLIQCFY